MAKNKKKSADRGGNDANLGLEDKLSGEIVSSDRNAWKSLHSDTSRPFDKPSSDLFAVKGINHFGDEVMKVFGV